MCKCNIVFFQQQCDDIAHHSTSLPATTNKMHIEKTFRGLLVAVALLSATFDPAAVRAEGYESEDRIWLISTRGITAEACRVNLDHPSLRVSRVTSCGGRTDASLDEYLATLGSRKSVIYVHGNRMASDGVISRALAVYRRIRPHRASGPVDWVIWSWPSEKSGLLVHDFRRKATRIDAQSLYLGWLLRRHATADTATTLIGYSFGAPVVTGALHAAAGGRISGRQVPGEMVQGAGFTAGLIAPAMERNWMAVRGKHELASKNLASLLVLYNRRDAVLKRYWLLDRVRGAMALGYSGPRSFAPRFDGSKLQVRSRDCSATVGINHAEMRYYTEPCWAGSEVAKVINKLTAK